MGYTMGITLNRTKSGNAKLSDWNILIVEDDPYSQQLLSLVFSHSQIHSEVAGSAEEAWEMLTSGKSFTAAILDIMLPGMDGWTLHQRMKDNPAIKHIPCVVMTASHSEKMSK